MNILESFFTDNQSLIEKALIDIRTVKYSTKLIDKKNGNKRELSIPPFSVKTLQAKLNILLQDSYTPPKPVYAFVKSDNSIKRTIVTNASQHINKHFVLNIDIENFFDNINFGRVRGLLLAKPYELNEIIATKLAQLMTYENRLPQGAPTSPILSNIICKKLDHELMKLAKKNHMSFTRYADDITFSSKKKNIDLEMILEDVEKIINNNGFKINSSKTRIQKFYQTQIVTGLKVNKKVNVSRKYTRLIRSMLFSWYKHGLAIASFNHFKSEKQRGKYSFFLLNTQKSFIRVLQGKINFLGQVKGINNPLYLKYLYSFNLLKNNFIINKNNDFFENFDLSNIESSKVQMIFTPIFDSKLVFVEGLTDAVYIKAALKHYQNHDLFKELHLRFCNLGGWPNVMKMHGLLYGNKKDYNNDKVKEIILPQINKNMNMYFVLDADDNDIINYFKNVKQTNHFLIDEKNNGYIEKLFDQTIVIELINQYGYKIDTNRTELDKKTKQKLIRHQKENSFLEKIFSIDNYIVFKDKLIKKTRLATLITEREDIDYHKFIPLFVHIKHY